MEALSILKFWRNTAAGGDEADDDVRNTPALFTDDEETDDEDSFFDLVLRSPDSGAKKEASKKTAQFIESPRDVFLNKNDTSGSKPMLPVTILRSAPKLKVFMLGFKKSSKCEKTEAAPSPLSQLSKPAKLDGSNRFSVKWRVAEAPASPVFARDNSLRSKMLKESAECENPSHVVSSVKSLPKYLKLMKPFYSKKTKLTDSLTPSSSPVTVPVNLSPRKFSEGNRVGSFKIVTRNLGKSRSAMVDTPSVRRRDDSLLEQNDGIQGAILHCKKSYSSPSQDFSLLFRSSSDPSHQNLSVPGRISWEEQKRCSI